MMEITHRNHLLSECCRGATDYATVKSLGSRTAASIGGAVTGHGADHIIIDDLMKAADATSEA
ncbi:MAG: hypothetical protein D6781_14590, partial [Verrucomicrobia bacterium]